MSSDEGSLRPRPGETPEQAVERVIAWARANPRFPDAPPDVPGFSKDDKLAHEVATGARTQLNVTTGELDNLRRLAEAQREIHEITDDIFNRRKGTKRAEREDYARRLNRVAVTLHTVELNLGGGS